VSNSKRGDSCRRVDVAAAGSRRLRNAAAGASSEYAGAARRSVPAQPTGFTTRHIANAQANHYHAGLERRVRMKDGAIACLPGCRIFKSPYFTSRYAEWIGASNIEAVIIPIREARAAAHSMAMTPFVSRNEEEQLRRNTQIVYDFINALAAADVPMIFLNYPRHVEDPAYAYRRLKGVLENMNISKSDFIRGHNATFHANFVHSNHTTLASTSS